MFFFLDASKASVKAVKRREGAVQKVTSLRFTVDVLIIISALRTVIVNGWGARSRIFYSMSNMA